VYDGQGLPGERRSELCQGEGLSYAPGLREESARAILRARAARPLSSIDHLAVRVPALRKDEINRLAEIGALNSLERIHRRDALWQAQRAIRPVGPLLEELEEPTRRLLYTP
jgi:error-prone DNA polymerase